MKTLILNGSPHKKGDTAALTGALQGLLPGEVREVFSYFAQAGPCVDCRRCWKTEGCALHDGMDEIYAFLRQADNVVIASPCISRSSPVPCWRWGAGCNAFTRQSGSWENRGSRASGAALCWWGAGTAALSPPWPRPIPC